MTSTPEGMVRHFKQQAQAQREQLDMIHAQKESIDSLKQMILQLLEDKRRSRRPRLLPRSPRANRRKRKAHSLHISRRRSIPTPSEEDGNLENGSTHSKRMSKLEQHLEALTNRKDLQEAGVPTIPG